jgi:hypothetical protein
VDVNVCDLPFERLIRERLFVINHGGQDVCWLPGCFRFMHLLSKSTYIVRYHVASLTTVNFRVGPIVLP